MILLFLSPALMSATWSVNGKGPAGSIRFTGTVIPSATIQAEFKENQYGDLYVHYRISQSGSAAEIGRLYVPDQGIAYAKLPESKAVIVAGEATSVASLFDHLHRETDENNVFAHLASIDTTQD